MLVGLLAALALTGCDVPAAPGVHAFPQTDEPRLYQSNFPDAGVSCWVLVGYRKAGLSCVRVSP